jgi:hypothetical protein
MSTRSKTVLTATVAGVVVYALAPFVAGLLKTYDRRGPKIFVGAHHELFYTFGYYMAGHHHHDGKPREPYMQGRSWFYGFTGEPIDDRAIREKLEALSRDR